MRSPYALLFLLVFCSTSIAQKNISSLLKQAEVALYSDPQEAIRIAQYISEKSDQPSHLLQSAYILTRGFYMEGKYNEALKIGLKFSEEESEQITTTQLQLNILVSKILKELEINSLAIQYSNKAKKTIEGKPDSDSQNWVNGKIIQYGLGKKNEDSNTEIFAQLYIAKSKLEKVTSPPYSSQIGNIYLEIANMHLREFQIDSAQYYLSKSFFESKKEKSGNYLEMKSLIKYGAYLFLKKSNSEAIDTLNAAMRIAEKFTNLPEQLTIAEAIAKNYLVLNDLKSFNSYNQKAEELIAEWGDDENDAVNTAYNFYTTNEATKFSRLRSTSNFKLLLVGSVLGLLLLFWGFTRLRYRAKIKQYQKFLNYLEKRKDATVVSPTPKLNTSKSLNIPKEAEELLLIKLSEFENSLDYTSKEISLSRMALQFETNTKYLSELINTHKQKNFNAYINELRINYITDKLKNNPQYLQYKISYLAEDSGFSSHSVFATVFKSITGISPTTFITILQNKQESQAV